MPTAAVRPCARTGDAALVVPTAVRGHRCAPTAGRGQNVAPAVVNLPGCCFVGRSLMTRTLSSPRLGCGTGARTPATAPSAPRATASQFAPTDGFAEIARAARAMGYASTVDCKRAANRVGARSFACTATRRRAAVNVQAAGAFVLTIGTYATAVTAGEVPAATPSDRSRRRSPDVSNRGERESCAHRKRVDACRECGGWNLCEHGNRPYRCRQCVGAPAALRCPGCAGAEVCPHGRLRSFCSRCIGSAYLRSWPATALLHLLRRRLTLRSRS